MISPSEATALDQGTLIYHRTLRNADGTALRARVNGRPRLWKTRPDYYEIPMKHGLRNCFYLTPQNANAWSLTDPTLEPSD